MSSDTHTACTASETPTDTHRLARCPRRPQPSTAPIHPQTDPGMPAIPDSLNGASRGASWTPSATSSGTAPDTDTDTQDHGQPQTHLARYPGQSWGPRLHYSTWNNQVLQDANREPHTDTPGAPSERRILPETDSAAPSDFPRPETLLAALLSPFPLHVLGHVSRLPPPQTPRTAPRRAPSKPSPLM